MNTATTPGLAEAASPNKPAELEKIVVAIHGIGQQSRNSTIRSVAQRFGDRCEPPLPVLPLGYFSIAEGSDVRWSRLETSGNERMAHVGFAEVYWADIPVELVKANDTLEESKAWARTIVSRAEAIYRRQVKNTPNGGKLDAEDFKQGMDAIDGIVEGIAVVEKLCALAEKAGLFKFEAGALLRDYAGDVQIVTEFPHYRNKILYRFHAVLNAIVRTYQKHYPGKEPEIYLVAHSEGTVISLLALLQALSSQRVKNPDQPADEEGGDWVQYTRGFMTIGSPIDKHIALWPGLWEGFRFTTRCEAGGALSLHPAAAEDRVVSLKQPIQWRNYFDFGDPVGFRLDAAQRALGDMGCAAFEFDTLQHDFGYSRYWMPGKAHVDYWDDPELFRHFIDSVVQPQAGTPKVPPPPSRPVCDVVAKWLPYAVSFLLHLAAVLLIYQGLSVAVDHAQALREIAVLGTLLAAVTAAGRIPLLVKWQPRWAALSLACLLAGGLVAWFGLTDAVAHGIGRAFGVAGNDAALAVAGKAALIASAALVALCAGWIVPRGRAAWGRKALLWGGTLLCAAIVLRGFMDQEASLWAIAGGCVAFLYLWWLAIILFDLAFVWHRYIRQAVCVQTLRAWQQKHDQEPDPLWGLAQDPQQKEIDARHGRDRQ